MLSSLLTLSHVPRWAIIDTTKTQTVADHSFRVAAMCLELIRELRVLHIQVDAEGLLRRAIVHDAAEAKSGDLPTPYKRMLSSMGFDSAEEESSLEYCLLKVADCCEAITFLDRYGIRSKRIRTELGEALSKYKQMAWETMEAPEVVSHAWWNRIVEKILEVGAEYE